MNAVSSSAVDLLRSPLIRAGDLTERSIDGELVIYDPARQKVHALNATAAFIWNALDGSRGLDVIVALLSERYPDCRQSIEVDVADTVKAFLDEGLLVA